MIENMNIIALCRRPITRKTKKVWNEIMNFENEGLENIIAGNFNALNTLRQNTDSNREILFEIMNNLE